MLTLARRLTTLLRPRFSLAALLLFMTLAAAFFAWVRAADQHYRRQQAASFRLLPLGGLVMGWGSERAPGSWVGEWCGCEPWYRTVRVDFHHHSNTEREPTEAEWEQAMLAFRELPDLRRLDLDEHVMLSRPDRLQWLLNVPQVEELRLEYSESQADLEVLRQLPRLRHLELWCMRLDEAYFRELAKLQQLELLELHSCPQSDGLAHLARLPKLTSLELRGPEFDDAEIVAAVSCAHLKRMELDYTEFTDAGLMKFASHQRLESIDVTGTDVTPAGIAAFRAVNPICQIITNGHD